MGILLYLAGAFKLWMIFDAIRRRVDLIWFFVLLFPGGDWIYFVAVKLRDFAVGPAAPTIEEPQVDLDALRGEAEASPSFHNRVRLGWALLEANEPEEAQRYFELGLSTHADDRDALYGQGLALLRRGESARAVEVLSRLVDRSLAYDDYRAAMLLAEALFESEQREDALELLRTVTRTSSRLDVPVTLAKYQLRADLAGDAVATLQGVLDEFERLPDYLRRRNGAIATEARQLLRNLGAGQHASS